MSLNGCGTHTDYGTFYIIFRMVKLALRPKTKILQEGGSLYRVKSRSCEVSAYWIMSGGQIPLPAQGDDNSAITMLCAAASIQAGHLHAEPSSLRSEQDVALPSSTSATNLRPSFSDPPEGILEVDGRTREASSLVLKHNHILFPYVSLQDPNEGYH
jgi:hypothetical protein